MINLALITGNMGRPGTGANSVTGQCNAMGSRLFANATSLLGGHDFEKPEDRRKIARILDIDAACIPEQNSWAYHEILEGILDGKIRGLWVIGTNPAHSWINQDMLGDVLARLDFLVVQDMYTTTETAQRAELLLPAAAWGEKDGTFINSERRMGLIEKVPRRPGESLADFSIFHLGRRILGMRRDVPRVDRSGGRFPDSQGGRRRTRRATSPALPTIACSTNAAGSSGPMRRARLIPHNKGGCSPTAATITRAAGRRSSSSARRMPESPSHRYPFLLLTGRRFGRAVAHADPHGKIAHSAATRGPDGGLRRDQSGRRRAGEHPAQPDGPGQVAAGARSGPRSS